MYAITFDADAVRSAYARAANDFLQLCTDIAPDDWDKPGLEDWTVRELVGHTARALTTVRDYLAAGAGKGIELQHAFDYFPAVSKLIAANPGSIRDRAREAAQAMGPNPLAWLQQLSRDVLAQVERAPDDAPVMTLVGGMRLIDYLPTRLLELTVHSADIASATRQPFAPSAHARVIAWSVAAGIAALSPDAVPGLLAITGRGPLPEGFSVVP